MIQAGRINGARVLRRGGERGEGAGQGWQGNCRRGGEGVGMEGDLRESVGEGLEIM